MSRRPYLGPTRYICTVFDEMRKLDETKNYSSMLSLIEEAQILANRMEASLDTNNTIKDAEKYIKSLKKEIKTLEEQKEKLEDEKN